MSAAIFVLEPLGQIDPVFEMRDVSISGSFFSAAEITFGPIKDIRIESVSKDSFGRDHQFQRSVFKRLSVLLLFFDHVESATNCNGEDRPTITLHCQTEPNR